MPHDTHPHNTAPHEGHNEPHSTPATGRRAQTGQASRRALLALLGIGAAGAGAWWATHRGAGSPATEAGTGDSAAGATSQAASGATAGGLPANFWTQAFDTPEGGTLALSNLKGKPILINFWATWCPPCVKEMPELNRFHSEFAPKGWQVLGLAIDGPTPVKEFLAKVQVGFAIGLAGFGGTELAQALGNEAGGLPFSVMIDAQGRVLHRKMGATTHDELAQWAQAVTASSAAGA